MELLFPCGVISFSKFDHRPSDQADFLNFRSLCPQAYIFNISQSKLFLRSQNFKISYCDHNVILRGDVNHFMFSMLPC